MLSRDDSLPMRGDDIFIEAYRSRLGFATGSAVLSAAPRARFVEDMTKVCPAEFESSGVQCEPRWLMRMEVVGECGL